MDFSHFDSRNYPVLDVAAGYDEWSATYEDVVRDEMDLRLLRRVTTVSWSSVEHAVDLACGTGRVGVWLRDHGVTRLDGLDLTSAMLERAREQGIYDHLHQGDLRSTPLPEDAYDLALVSLADEHLPMLDPMYDEVARLLAAGGMFVIAGFHPQFLMSVGMPTHFHRADGQPVAIETHVHLLSDHVTAARASGFELLEMHEGIVDDEYVAAKPKWTGYRNIPVSFVFAWRLRTAFSSAP